MISLKFVLFFFFMTGGTNFEVPAFRIQLNLHLIWSYEAFVQISQLSKDHHHII